MTVLSDAFVRAGIPAGDIAFAAACRNLAKLSLNDTDGNCKRAVGRFLDLARQPDFRDGPLANFIAGVAASRNAGAGKDHPEVATQSRNVAPSPAPHTPALSESPAATADHDGVATQLKNVSGVAGEPNSRVGYDQSASATQARAVDSTLETSSPAESEDQPVGATHDRPVPSAGDTSSEVGDEARMQPK